MHLKERFGVKERKISVMNPNVFGRKFGGSAFKKIDSIFSLPQNIRRKLPLVIQSKGHTHRAFTACRALCHTFLPPCNPVR